MALGRSSFAQKSLQQGSVAKSILTILHLVESQAFPSHPALSQFCGSRIVLLPCAVCGAALEVFMGATAGAKCSFSKWLLLGRDHINQLPQKKRFWSPNCFWTQHEELMLLQQAPRGFNHVSWRSSFATRFGSGRNYG